MKNNVEIILPLPVLSHFSKLIQILPILEDLGFIVVSVSEYLKGHADISKDNQKHLYLNTQQAKK